MRSLPLLLFTLVIAGSCHEKDSSSKSVVTQAADSLIQVRYKITAFETDTTLFAQPKQVGELANGVLAESSGLAASQQNPGYLWTEEDSGNPNQIQLINLKGDVVGQYTLAGLTNNDWEEITVGAGPLPGTSYIYVAEIGDNQLRRPIKTIYRFPEPTYTPERQPVSATITKIDVIRLKMPDGPTNSEAILLEPGTLDLYVFSKEEKTVVYRARYPQSLTKATLMERQLVTPVDYITAATISPSGREILLRTYDELFYFTRNAGESITEALKRPPRLLPLAQESQGEAISWAIATPGSEPPGYYTTSERAGFSGLFFPRPLYYYRRK